MTSDSIIGVDRTFNLGPCFLTCMVYQNHNLIRKHTKSSPIMLGPMFLHWDGLYSTYCEFFLLNQVSIRLSYSRRENCIRKRRRTSNDQCHQNCISKGAAYFMHKAFKRKRAEKSFGSKCSRKIPKSRYFSYIWVHWLNLQLFASRVCRTRTRN